MEYALIGALVAVVIVSSVTTYGRNLASVFSTVTVKL